MSTSAPGAPSPKSRQASARTSAPVATTSEAWEWRAGVLAAFLAALAYASQTTLISLTRKRRIAYDTEAMVTKIFTASNLKNIFLMFVPALAYMVQNNLMFLCLSRGYLDAPHYQLFCNVKIATTSILYRLVMKKALTVLQWCSLMLLGVGMLVCAAKDVFAGAAGLEHQETKSSGTKNSPAFLYGIACVLGISLCSAFAGVTNEFLLKTASNMHYANAKMYAVGISFSLLYMLREQQVTDGTRTGGSSPSSEGPAEQGGPAGRIRAFVAQLSDFGFHGGGQGRSDTALLLIGVLVSQAFLGMCISFIFRFGNVILKIYQASLTTLLTTFLAWSLQGFEVKLEFVLGYVILLFSTFFFYGGKETLHKLDKDIVKDMCGARSERTSLDKKKQ
eukprot:g16703.t1